MGLTITKEIISKFDVPGPRYTSYPTAPEWSQAVTPAIYRTKLKDFEKTQKTLSLYVHIPFCEQLCYYCGCNVAIRPNDVKHGDEYLKFLFKEIDLIRDVIGKKREVRQLHWGGGTPTYLTEDQMSELFDKIAENFKIDFDGEVAIEVDPRTINASKLQILRQLGFNRLSMGIQDFNPAVQKTVNRIQDFKLVSEITQLLRELKFHSINYDLIYGLPHQTRKSFEQTIDQTIALHPDRIALYSFAYVPWLKKHQTKMPADTFPSNNEKLEIFLQAREQLIEAGYLSIAMDHFALQTDEMAKAFVEGKLYRNFMGYTVKPADEYIGFGVSSIGFLENTYIQNHKTLPEYYKALDQNELPIERGKVLSSDDEMRRWVISHLMCRLEIDKKQFTDRFHLNFDEYFTSEEIHIANCLRDRLLYVDQDKLKASELGKIFIRNICMGFDQYLQKAKSQHRFSKTI